VMSRSAAVASATVVAWLLTAPSAVAKCAMLTAQQVMAERAYEVVFRGTVVEITRASGAGYRATFDVDRVWKGAVSRRFDLYVWEIPTETCVLITSCKHRTSFET
jgi:hypothetical protein